MHVNNHKAKYRIVILKDVNNDGVYDKRIVYADQLELASSTLPYRQGLLIAPPPYLLFLKDTDGDQMADKRDSIKSGLFIAPSPTLCGKTIAPVRLACPCVYTGLKIMLKIFL